MEEGSGVVDGYVHAAIGPNMGKTAALVAIKLGESMIRPERCTQQLVFFFHV